MNREPASANEYARKKTGRMVDCPGEAHKNAFIDNCEQCVPRWGTVEELAPVDIAEARANRQDIPCGMPTKEQYDALQALERDGVVQVVGVERNLKGGSRCSYFVFRWV